MGEKRSRPGLVGLFITVALAVLVVGAVLAVDRLQSATTDPLTPTGEPATDQQSRAQATDAAREIVVVAGLHVTSASYMLMSCRDHDSPPYQGAVYVIFKVPADTRPGTYLPAVAEKVISDGWTEGLDLNGHSYGRILTKGGVTASVYGHDDKPDLGVFRVYGECRNTNDHRTDGTGWTDITGVFGPAG